MRSRSVGACVVAVSLLLAVPACSSAAGHASRTRMVVAPRATLLSDPVTVTVRGLAAGSTVRISARAVDRDGDTWTSSADFTVPSDGTVTSDDRARSGSYTGVNPIGLLTSMTSRAPDASGQTFISPADGYTIRFTATVAGHVVAAAATRREADSPTDPVRDTPLRPSLSGVYGELLVPSRLSGERTAVLVFGGSEGGDDGALFTGSQLAANGYPVLALAYFGEPSLPSQLRDIPLEYFRTALGILRAQPHVDPRRVVVYGVSRGGELALLLGATYPDLVDGVVAGVPSSNVNPAVGGAGAAWTLDGRPVPQGPIPVERIRGPVLQSCGGQDDVWDSCLFVSQIQARLAAQHFRYPVTTLRFPEAGHLGPQFACCLSEPTNLGGTVEGNASAQLASHLALLRFLAGLG